jgi:hypothetical protein
MNRLTGFYLLTTLLASLAVINGCSKSVTMLPEKSLVSMTVDFEIYSRFATLAESQGKINLVYSDDRTQSLKYAVVDLTSDRVDVSILDKIDFEIRATSLIGSHYYKSSRNEEYLFYADRDTGGSSSFKIQQRTRDDDSWYVYPLDTGSEIFTYTHCDGFDLVIYYKNGFKALSNSNSILESIDIPYDTTHDITAVSSIYSSRYNTVYCTFLDSVGVLWQMSVKLSSRQESPPTILQVNCDSIASDVRLFALRLDGNHPALLYFDESDLALKHRYITRSGVTIDTVGYFAEISSLSFVKLGGSDVFVIVSRTSRSTGSSPGKFLVSLVFPENEQRRHKSGHYIELGVMELETPSIAIDAIVSGNDLYIVSGANELALVKVPLSLLPAIAIDHTDDSAG